MILFFLWRDKAYHFQQLASSTPQLRVSQLLSEFGNEEGELDLAGTVSGALPFFIQTVAQKTNNSTLLAGTAFQNSAGNIGVNMASGTGNLQSNNLALTSITAASDVIEP